MIPREKANLHVNICLGHVYVDTWGTYGIIKVSIGKVMSDRLQHYLNILLRSVQYRIRSSIISVRYQFALPLFLICPVQLFHQLNNGTADIVHVEDGWGSVETASVEVVGVGHGDFCESVKIALLDGFRDLDHSIGNDGGDTVLKEGRGSDGTLHAGGGGGALFGVRDDTDESLEIGPVRLRGDFDSERVLAGGVFSALPGDVASEEGSTG